MEKDKRLMEAFWWQIDLRGKLGLVLMGWAMLNKSLIQFSVDGQGCVPFLFFDLRPNYGAGSEDNFNLFQKVPCIHSYTQCPQPCCRPSLTLAICQRLLDTHRQVWVNLLWGHCSCLLGPDAHKVVCALQESVS